MVNVLVCLFVDIEYFDEVEFLYREVFEFSKKYVKIGCKFIYYVEICDI